MCLILVAFKIDHKYPLIVAANRDEYFARPTAEAHYWHDYPEIFGGRDLQEQGTWMGISTTGRFAAVANWSRKNELTSGYRSRGDLVREFLLSQNTSLDVVSKLKYHDYRGCNLIVYDGAKLVYWCNNENLTTTLAPGFHVVTNASLNALSPRANFGLSQFSRLAPGHNVQQLLKLLGPRKPAQAGKCFIFGDTYGTRSSSTYFLGTTTVTIHEQQYGPNAKVGALTVEEVVLSTR